MSGEVATTAQPARYGRRSIRLGVRFLGLGYLLLLLALPVGLVFYRTFESGIAPVIAALKTPAFQHAFWMTVTIAAIAVPVNTIFGVVTALALVRRRFPGRGLLNAVIDLPFALSPVVIGLSLVLVYGKNGWFGPALGDLGFQVIYALPGMVIATIFVSLPFVVREVIPVLREIGTDQEEAAYTLGASPMRTFWKVTLPAIRWGVIYGVILTTARSLGEFGAVSIVSGRLSGKTETLTLYVEDRYHEFDLIGAYAAAVVLALLALAVLLAMNVMQSGRGSRAREWVGDLLRLGSARARRGRGRATLEPTQSTGTGG
ncbi:MAG: sulfate/thiosulfate transport system permease protein [Thermoleophilaceae bacterium]|jgi:sulfate transport system permease protein|nr:sulfate/thiosulfate transport system permease protein [Thermoleophilaceae bacterium]MEA2622910.1 sulfate/thiosulfate transport system permease protein [Chloroflexota bacterium]